MIFLISFQLLLPKSRLILSQLLSMRLIFLVLFGGSMVKIYLLFTSFFSITALIPPSTSFNISKKFCRASVAVKTFCFICLHLLQSSNLIGTKGVYIVYMWTEILSMVYYWEYETYRWSW